MENLSPHVRDDSVSTLGISVTANAKVVRDLTGVFSFGYHEGPKMVVPENLTPEQRLLIGDPNLPELRQKELLHLSAPDRPDFYTEYAGKYFSEHDKLPADYLKISARIDPENSFPLYNAAARDGGDSCEKIKSSKSVPARYSGKTRLREIPDETVWKIDDAEKFSYALELITKASSLTGYDTYETHLAKARLTLFDQERLIPRVRTIGYFGSQSSQVIAIRKVADLISAQAYCLSLAGDKENFLKLYADSEAFLTHLSRAPESTLIAELVYSACGAGTATAFHFGAERLGLPELAEKMQLRRKALIDDANARNLREDPMLDRLPEEGSIITFLTAPGLSRQVANPPSFDLESLTPGRLAEYDVYSTVILPALVTLLGLVSLAIFVSSYLLPRPVKLLSKRFDLLLRHADWAWIAGAVILPIALTLLITRYTTLGGRSFNLRHNQMMFPVVHYLLIFLLLLTVPPAVIHWRLGKRLRAFGIARNFHIACVILPTIGVLVLLIAHPVIEHFSLSRESRNILPLAFFPAMWSASILIGFGMMYFGKTERRIERATAVGILPVALSFAIILLAALVPIFRESAEKWIVQDNFSRVVPTGLSFYEAEIARQKRIETNAILER